MKSSCYLSSSLNVFIPQSFVYDPLNLKQKETDLKKGENGLQLPFSS